MILTEEKLRNASKYITDLINDDDKDLDIEEIKRIFDEYMIKNGIEFIYSDSSEVFYEEINFVGLTQEKAYWILDKQVIEQ